MPPKDYKVFGPNGCGVTDSFDSNQPMGKPIKTTQFSDHFGLCGPIGILSSIRTDENQSDVLVHRDRYACTVLKEPRKYKQLEYMILLLPSTLQKTCPAKLSILSHALPLFHWILLVL